MTVTRLLARPMLASTFLVSSVGAIKNADAIAPKADLVVDKVAPMLRRAGVPISQDPATVVKLNAGVQLAAALALATGRMPRLSAGVLAASLVPTTLAGHRFWQETEEPARTQQRLHFLKNLSVLGGLVIAAGDTEGRPGVAWRARHAARAARREARHLTRSAAQEARLAKAKMT